MKCLACEAGGKIHGTEAGQFGPACQKHIGLIWGLWVEVEPYLRAVDLWRLRRERAESLGQNFTEESPKGPGEKALELVIFERGLTADARELA